MEHYIRSIFPVKCVNNVLWIANEMMACKYFIFETDGRVFRINNVPNELPQKYLDLIECTLDHLCENEDGDDGDFYFRSGEKLNYNLDVTVRNG